ncbi:MAG: hypothetical protein ACE5Q3_03475 [Alphaproteobacteria bacterium]
MRRPNRHYRAMVTAPRHVRVAIGAALIIGGLFFFLPILGLWMIPLGALVILFDVPWVRRRWLDFRWRWKDVREKIRRRRDSVGQ